MNLFIRGDIRNAEHFTINFRGVYITPQVEHLPRMVLLRYDYMGYHVEIGVDSMLFLYLNPKSAYIEDVKRATLRCFEDAYNKDVNDWYNKMGLR